MKTVYEVFKKIDDLKQAKRREDLLRDNDNFVVRTILQATFSPKIKFGMPSGMPPFKEKEDEPIEISDQMIRALGDCINTSLPYYQREQVFINLIEQVHPDDRKVLVAMKDKDFSKEFPSITKKFVAKIFPNLVK